MNTFRISLLALVASLSLACVVDKNKPEALPPKPEPKPEPIAEVRVYPDPPPPSDPRPVEFPALQKFQLTNGLQVFVVENHEVPLVSVQLSFKAGTVYDELLARFTAAMLSEGTGGKRGLSKAEIDERIESVGASLYTGAGEFNSSLATRVLKPDLPMALDLLAEVASNPKLDPEALTKIQDDAKIELRNQKSQATELGRRLLGQVLFPKGHPYGRPFATPEQIDAVTVEQLRTFHTTWYAPNNAFLLIAGDITLEEAQKLVEAEFGKLAPAKSFPEHPLSAFTAEHYQAAKPTKPAIYIVDRTSISTEILMANLSLARNHQDWVEFSLTNRILGGSASARLFKDLREDKGLTYGAYSSISSSKAVGAFSMWTQSKYVEESLVALLAHLRRIRSEAPSQAEYENAQRSIAQSFPLTVETAGQVADMIGEQITYGLPDDYFATYRDKILAVTIDDVQTMANKWIDPNPVIVMVGRKKKILSALASIDELKDSEVVVYDTELVEIERVKP